MDNFLSFRVQISGFLLTGLLLLSFASFSQQQQIYNQFFMNPYIYNPAYAGVDGHGVVFAMYKQQWSKIDGGPSLSHVTYHHPLKGGVGIGVLAFNESLGPLTTSAGKVTGSYLLNIDRKHFLRFGMSFGMGTNQVTVPEDGILDPAFAGSSSNYLIGDVGFTYHFDHFNVGVSIPNLFSSGIVSENGLESSFAPTEQILIKGNYRGHINHEFAIEPHILYRYSSVLPDQFEVATVIHILHLAWVGATYRQYAGMVGLVGFKVKKKFAVGAAFELGNQDINSLTGNSFEIHVGMHFGGHREHRLGHVDHHRTWFQTHSEEHLARAAARRRADSLAAIQDIRAQVENTNPLIPEQQEPEPIKWDRANEVIAVPTATGVVPGQRMSRTNEDGEMEIIIATAPPRDGGSAWTVAPGIQELPERINDAGETEVGVKWIRIGADGTLEDKVVWTPIMSPTEATAYLSGEAPTETTTDVQENEADETAEVVVQPDPDPVTPQPLTYAQLAASDDHLEVTRGNHFLELPVGNYVIGGVFDSFQDAEDFSDEIFHKGFRETIVGRVSERGHYYVVLESFGTIEEAKRNKSRIRTRSGINEVWALKVNE